MRRLPLVPSLVLAGLLASAPSGAGASPSPFSGVPAAATPGPDAPGAASPGPVVQEPDAPTAGPEGLGEIDLGEQLEPAWGRIRGRLAEGVMVLPLLLVAAAVFLAFALLALWARRWDHLYRRLSPNLFVRNLLEQAVRAVILLLGLMVAVDILGVTTLVGAVLGTAGIAGVALGFAFKDIVENYLAGVLLSLRQPFAPNDDVVIEGQRGKVVRLTSRDTILMSPDGNHVRIPNATVFRAVMVNYTRNPRRRFEVRLTVAPDTDLRDALEAGLRVLRTMEGVLEKPAPSGRVVDVGDSWITLTWFGWVDQERADYAKVRSEAVRLLLDGLTAAGVAMPPPEHRIQLVGPEEEPRPPTPPTQGPGTREPQLDVSVDTALDEQITEDRRDSTEVDLLEPGEA